MERGHRVFRSTRETLEGLVADKGQMHCVFKSSHVMCFSFRVLLDFREVALARSSTFLDGGTALPFKSQVSLASVQPSVPFGRGHKNLTPSSPYRSWSFPPS